MTHNKVIRVGISNNFNATKKEYKQLNKYKGRGKLFVNSNIRTITKITAPNINNNPMPIVITINPDIIFKPEYLEKLKLINKYKIAFIRLKYCPSYNHDSLYNTLVNMGYKVVITVMRFRSKQSFYKYVLPEYRKLFKYSGGYYRQNVDNLPSHFIHICDRKGKGCSSCFLCSTLTHGIVNDIYGLNLSTSGKCRFNCPDCFAKICSQRVGGKVLFNTLKQNAKQKKNKG